MTGIELETPVEPAITVQGLTMTFRAPVRDAGLRAALGSVFRRRYRRVEAVREVSFRVASGEVVGFIGPNGAGKTTTLKILSGELHPTAGEARVTGHTPWRREESFLRQIAFIRGSRPLGGPPEVTVLDHLRMKGLIYDVPAPEFRRTLQELTELLQLEPLMARQIRALSLGERMRAALASSLLYRPRVLFLDEPTIGLDVSATAVVRRFIAEYSRQTGATMLLTSHYMADVASLCRRVLLIDRGALQYDGPLAGLAARLAPWKLIKVVVPEGAEGVSASVEGGGARNPAHPGAGAWDWTQFGEVVSYEGGAVTLRIPRASVAAVTTRLLAAVPVADLTVEEPPLEHVMDQVYRQGLHGGESGPDAGPERQAATAREARGEVGGA
ncbi:MAG TPA: ATP-binding cassette domain-containing protein [Chloroflexota bacterium]|nr:ATP-binding cassette domain-containing protein [Chloroflexota bacterium]